MNIKELKKEFDKLPQTDMTTWDFIIKRVIPVVADAMLVEKRQIKYTEVDKTNPARDIVVYDEKKKAIISFWDIWSNNFSNAKRFFESKGNITTRSKLKAKWYKDFEQALKDTIESTNKTMGEETLNEQITKIRDSWGEDSEYCGDEIDEAIWKWKETLLSAERKRVGEVIDGELTAWAAGEYPDATAVLKEIKQALIKEV